MKVEVEWIKTSDKLPENDQEVLYCIPDGESGNTVNAGYYDADWRKFCAGIEGIFQDDPEDVMCWMPFPDPPISTRLKGV